MLYIRRGRKSSFYLPKIIPVLGTALFLLSLFANAWTLSARAVAPGISEKKTESQTAVVAKAANAGVVSDQTITTTKVPTTTQITSQETGTCSTTRPYRAPAIVDLTVAHDGLTAIVSEPYTYVVSASTLSGLRSGVTNCPIRAEVAGSYHAITARQIAWSYSFAQVGAQCTITNVRVGLHVTQLLPDFSPKAGTAQSVINAWNTYHASLLAHENGHVDVAKRYAAELVEKLNALGTMNCGAIQTLARTTVDSQLKALNTTDTDYDAVTGHGATQGALL
jgi:predicted secreted Zn-dependent protease